MLDEDTSLAREREGTGRMSHRRLLFVALYFPPLTAISAVRSWSMATFLARLGWEVSVLTARPTLWRTTNDLDVVDQTLQSLGIRRIETDFHWRVLCEGKVKRSYDGIGRVVGGALRRVRRILKTDPAIGWLRPARAAVRQLNPADYDVVLATGAPWIAFDVADEIRQRCQIPMVLDYRDLWTAGNPYDATVPPRRHVQRESRLIRSADQVTVISPSMADSLTAEFNIARPNVVTNGYDAAHLADVSAQHFDHFAIVYTGSLPLPKRDLSPFLRALQRLETDVDWRFHYYGLNSSYVESVTSQHGLRERTEIHGSVPRNEALSAIRGANMALVITSVDETASLGDRGVVTGKFFEPIGLRTPVLVIAPPESDIETIMQTTGGGAVCCAADTQGIAEFLGKMMHGETVEFHDPDQFSWDRIALQMQDILESAINGRDTRS